MTSTLHIYGVEIDVPVTKEAVHEQELMKSDFVKLSWNDGQYRVLPVDAYIEPFGDGVRYSLLEPYIPEQKNATEWKYEPQFHHPKMYLGKCIFQRPSEDTSGNDITYIDWPYTGTVSTLLTNIVEAMNTCLGLSGDDKFEFGFLDFTDKVISTQFSSNDILSSLTNIANVCECEWHIDWKNKMLYFGKISIEALTTPILKVNDNIQVPSLRDSKDGYFNAFLPQGSTRNIMRKSASSEFVQSDVRLALDKTSYPDGILYTDGNGNEITKEQFEQLGCRLYLKPLIFEEVYPRMDLYLYNPRYRERYRLDENGEKVVAYTDDNGVQHYMKYAVWYFRLAKYIGGEGLTWADYKLDGSAIKAKVIEDISTTSQKYKLDIPFNSRYFGKNSSYVWINVLVNKHTYEARLEEEPTQAGGEHDYGRSIHANLDTYHNFTLNIGDEVLITSPLAPDVDTYIDPNPDYCIPKENIISNISIIDGKKPIIAFQPNTEVDALTTPLAGLGSGDGEGHYGFSVKYLRDVEKKSPGYIAEANKTPTEEGDTGIIDATTGVPSTVDDNYYEVEFEESDTSIIPSILEQGIIPKGYNYQSKKNNLVNFYNVVISDEAEDAAKVELRDKTLEYIKEKIKDNHSRTFKSNPISFESNNPELFLGEKAILDDGLDSSNPSRVSADHRTETRVMKLVVKLDYDFEQEITIGNEVIKGSQTQVKEKVEGIINGNISTGGSVSVSLINNTIKSFGSTLFLSKTVDDVAQGAIGFVKGIWIKAKELFGFDGEGNIKANNIDAAGDVVVGGLLTALSQVVNNAQSTNYVGGELAGTGWKLTNDNGEGNSRLEVDEVVARMRIVASVLEARQYCALGGNYVFSPAASIIDRVDYLNDDIHDSGSFVPDIYYGAGLYVTNTSFTIPAGATIYLSNEAGYDNIYLTDENLHDIVSSTSGTLSYTAEEYTVVKVKTVGQPTVTYKIYQEVIMGYEEVKVPWLLRKMPLWARNAVSARYKKVHMFSPDFDPSTATRYRCWIKADDGTTKTINTWRVGMLARCQTLDVEVSPDGHHGQTYYKDEVDEVTAHKNKFYWREVYAVGTGRLPIDDGYDHHYVDLSNETNHFYTGSDIPSAGDSIVCFGDRLNQDTSHLIIIETVGADAPAIKEYKSVGYVDGTSINWSLTGKMRTCISPTSGNIFIAPRFVVEIAEDDHRDLATFIVDTDGMRSTVKSSAGNRNLFSFKACTFGVATNDCGYPAVQSYGMLLRFAGDTDTTGRLARVRIPSLEVGKTYMLSCQIRMTGSVDAPEKTRIDIDLGDDHDNTKTIEATNSWQNIEVQLLFNNTSHPDFKWIDFGVWSTDYRAGNYALLRHIKLEEGGMATAFTVANEDANYVTNVRPVDEWLLNANIAEDSTVTCPSGKKVYKTLAMPSAPGDIDYISANGLTTIEIGKVYTISYWVKSSANNTHRVKTFMYPDLTPVLQDFLALVGDDGQTERIATDYETEVGVTTEWKKHYIHVYVMSLPSGGVVNCIPLRLTRTTGSALNTTGTLYISDVQLCEGYVSEDNNTINESYSEIKQTAYEITQRVANDEGQISQLQLTANGLTSDVNAIKAGKNLLGGVLTGNGWKSNGVAVSVNNMDGMKGFYTGGASISFNSPLTSQALEAEKTYVISLFANGSASVAVYDNSDNVLVPSKEMSNTTGDTIVCNGVTYTRRFTTFSINQSIAVKLVFALSGTSADITLLFHPQLELGNTPTAFDAGTTETSSRITQTADEIEGLVNDTGVNIQDKTISLYADKVKFYKNKASAQAGDPEKIWIDGGDGSLHAVNAVLSGSLLYHRIIRRNTGDVAVFSGDTAASIALLGDIVIVGGSFSSSLLVNLPPAKFFEGAHIKIVNATYSINGGNKDSDPSIITLNVIHSPDTEARAEDNYHVATNNMAVAVPFVPAGASSELYYDYYENLTFQDYIEVEIVSEPNIYENPTNPIHHVWTVIGAR